MLFGLASPKVFFIQEIPVAYIENFTWFIHMGRVGYVEPLCGYAKRSLLSFYDECVYEGVLKFNIEVKAWSDKCLAKCTTLVRGDDTYF